jgi:hypothetical protein
MIEKIVNFDFASLYPSSFSIKLFNNKTIRKNKLKNIFQIKEENK